HVSAPYGPLNPPPQRSAAAPLAALVTGSEEYLVTLRYDARTLWAACTCPYSDDHIDICKHIWATLIECAAKKIAFPGPVDDLLIDDQAADFDDDDDFYVEPSRWRSQLGSLTHYAYDRMDNARIPPEIIWVLDPAASATAVSI